MPTNCTAYGNPGDERYSRPLPWIGLYVAAASLVCTICMASDLCRSLRRRKLWIASKVFPLNAATLTVLAVATKIPADITTAMPGVFDQLAKLSGTVLICITMNHVMPSLGSMDGNGAILSNVIALGILVVTVFVNIWIQIYTGVVSSFKRYNMMFSLSMLLVFVIFVSYSITVTTTKKMLEKHYESKHQQILRETPPDVYDKFSVNQLRDYIDKYWLMGLTSSSDYTLLGSGMCSVSSILCYGTIGVIFIEAVISQLSGITPSWSCFVSSDYKWSTWLVFSIQALAILLGLIASLMREGHSRLSAISFSNWRNFWRIEKHWVALLEELRDAPLPLEIRNRRVRKVVYSTKNFVFALCLKLQIGVILTSKLFLMTCIWTRKHIFGLLCLLLKLLKRCWRVLPTRRVVDKEEEVKKEEEERSLVDLSEYVLYLEGEEDSIKATEVVRRWKKYPKKWIENGRSKQPLHLLELLRNHSSSTEGFEELCGGFDGVDLEELPRCWALPLVTLATVARAVLPKSEASMNPLMSAIGEGMRYVRFVERNLGDGQAKRMREAADMVWEGVDLHGRWLDVKLDKMASEEWRDTVTKLRDLVAEHHPECKHGSPLQWQLRVMAANCLMKLTGAMLAGGVYKAEVPLLEQLTRTIAHVLRACLANLPIAVLAQCSSGAFGAREGGVREAALVLGEAEEVLKFLGEERRVDLYSAFKEHPY